MPQTIWILARPPTPLGQCPNQSRFLSLEINIFMYHYSPIQGTRSTKKWKLWDESVPYFQQESGTCLLDWRRIMHWNVVLSFFQQPWYMHLCCKITLTTFSPTRPSGPSWSSSRDVRLLLSPSHAICLRGRTGAERASSLDWCNLNLNLDLE